MPPTTPEIPEDTDRLSYWLEEPPGAGRAPLQEEVRTDVAVIGAGIVGVTAAYLLGKEGVDVRLLERFRVSERDTGHTSAHLAHPDTSLPHMVEIHGEETAKKAYDANRFAIDLVERIQREAGVECDFKRLDGFLYAPRQQDVAHVKRFAELMDRIGHEAELVDTSGFPFDAEAVLRFPNQGRFHPVKYVRGLAEAAEGTGSVRIHEGTEVTEVDPEAGDDQYPAVIRTREGATIMARHVIVATHVPFVDRVRMWTRLYPYRSYCIGVRMPKGTLGDALYWDTLTPFHYTRIQPDGDEDVVIFGGEDHKTGHGGDVNARWERLEGTLAQALGRDVDAEWWWSAQDPQTQDGIPYIGVNPGSPPHELVATGFGGSGMTYGTLAAWMLAERVLGRTTEWDETFDPSRFNWGNLKRFVKENTTYPKHLVKGYVRGRHGPPLADLEPGQGTVVTIGGKKVAVSRDEDGELRAVSAVCTHMGCTVDWNEGEGSWDCPCHGSRFNPSGEVLEGPAPVRLDEVDDDTRDKVEGRTREIGSRSVTGRGRG